MSIYIHFWYIMKINFHDKGLYSSRPKVSEHSLIKEWSLPSHCWSSMWSVKCLYSVKGAKSKQVNLQSQRSSTSCIRQTSTPGSWPWSLFKHEQVLSCLFEWFFLSAIWCWAISIVPAVEEDTLGSTLGARCESNYVYFSSNFTVALLPYDKIIKQGQTLNIQELVCAYEYD